MPQFDDDYFRDLPPRDRRYDTPVADQLVFSVFPNGVKAWVHVYPCDDFVRRRTIGLFPETGYGAALEALDQSRRIVEVDSMETRRRPPPKRRGPRYLAVGLLAAIIASAATWLLIAAGGEDPASVPATVTPPAGGAGNGSEAVAPAPAADAPARAGPTGADDGSVGPAASKGGPATDGPDGRASTQPVHVAGNPPDSAGGEATTTEPGRETPPAGAPTGPHTPGVEPADDDPAASEVLQPAPSGIDDLGPAREPPPSAEARESRGDRPAIAEVAVPASDAVGEPGPGSRPGTMDESPPAVQVSRAALATDIIDREPVGPLTGEVTLPADGAVPVFFFTELHGRPGDRVEHRWELDGVTVSTMPFVIGGNGRWRVYSSKTIGPGHWRAVVVDADGREIESLPFIARIESP